MPAMKNSAPQTSVTSSVWPKSGCMHQQHGEHGVERDGELDAGHVAALLRLVEQPGGEHDEGWLDELRRLERDGAELEPALGALDLGAGHQDHGHQAMPTRKMTRLARRICFGVRVEAANMMTTAGSSSAAWRRTK